MPNARRLVSAGGVCATCGAEALREENSITTGFAHVREGGREFRICYECAATRERADMVATGRAFLYVTREVYARHPNGAESARYWVTNWPGTLRFRAHFISTGRHNIARTVHTLHFRGPDGFWWSARTWGGGAPDGIYCRARRIRERCVPNLGRVGIDDVAVPYNASRNNAGANNGR